MSMGPFLSICTPLPSERIRTACIHTYSDRPEVHLMPEKKGKKKKTNKNKWKIINYQVPGIIGGVVKGYTETLVE